MARLSKSHKASICICGHDIFSHDIEIKTGQPECTDGDLITAIISKCRIHTSHNTVCCCKKFYSIDTWFSNLWEYFEQYNT